jgi:HEAT repeat protein
MRRRGRARWFLGLGLVAAMFVAGRLLAAPSAYESALADLASASPATREAAVASLVDGGSRSLTTLLAEIDGRHAPLVKAGLVEAVKQLGVSTSQATALRALLSSRQVTTRFSAVQVIASTDGLMRAELLARAADSKESPAVRAAAAEALAGAAAELAGTKALAKDAAAPALVRGAAIRALGATGEDGAAEAKVIVLDAKRPLAERKAAIFGLSQGGSDGAAVLADLAEAETPWIRAEALAALASRGDADALSTLAAALSDEEAPVRAVALEGLLALGGGAAYAEEVEGLLADGDLRVKVLAVRHVATLGEASTEVLDTLSAFLADESANLRVEAALALHALGDASGAAAMAEDAESDDPSVARRAARAHRQITGE